MIEHGWIFPDGTEYSFEGTHEGPAKWFISGLKFQDLEKSKIIEEEIDKLFDNKPSPIQAGAVCTKYAICRLGWIMVTKTPLKSITYAGYDWQDKLVKPYLDKAVFIKGTSNYIPLTCDFSKAIQEGKVR